MSVTAEKAALRRRILAQLAGLSPAERERSDAMLFERFLQLPQV
ncbi:MAG: 5-formyltetrahydrofolate cyclo-ligase, partial [Oscillospiraceae bacterium]|nr:5-formyltetrahydrofolate cyclo-ligase [Oscillospiraceae bacterium]